MSNNTKINILSFFYEYSAPVVREKLCPSLIFYDLTNPEKFIDYVVNGKMKI